MILFLTLLFLVRIPINTKALAFLALASNRSLKKMIDNNVKFITLGTTDTGCTLVHYYKELLQVPYRYYKDFFGKIIDENSIQKECKIKYFVRKLDMPSILSVPKMKEIRYNCKKQVLKVLIFCLIFHYF